MKSIQILIIAINFFPFTIFANAELVQIVNFKWNPAAQKLEVMSFGSGTALAKDLVLTNKHVVKVEGEVADFLLLCPGQSQESRAVKCSVAAGVSALHSTMDVALVRTLDVKDFLPAVKTSTAVRRVDDVVRIVGFPVPDGSSAQNFGGTKTLEALEAWQKDPSRELNVRGDAPTTTRGKVRARYLLENTGEYYTQTNARVNFGNSGGAAFDQFGDYIGIPTLKDSLGNSYILEYAQMDDWVRAQSQKPARIEADAYTYYQNLRVKSQSSPQLRSSKTRASSNSSARLRYLQTLKNRAETPKSTTTSERRTTSRAYSRPSNGPRASQNRR